LGYQTPAKTAYIEITTRPTATITLSTVTADHNLTALTTPAYMGIAKEAYVDLYIQQLKDTSGALNYLDGAGNMQIELPTSSWTTCNISRGDSLQCPANSIESGIFINAGHIDVSNEILPNTTYNVKLDDWTSNGDDLELYAVYPKMRLFLE